jgi:hypothetical protein
MAWYQVKGWKKYQHYKNRKPPWIRLYRDLLDDMDYQQLPLASRALAPMMWLLASEDETLAGRVQCDSRMLAFRLRCDSKEIDDGIKPLINSGFLIPVAERLQDASTMLAERLQDAIPETEGDTEYLTKDLGTQGNTHTHIHARDDEQDDSAEMATTEREYENEYYRAKNGLN